VILAVGAPVRGLALRRGALGGSQIERKEDGSWQQLQLANVAGCNHCRLARISSAAASLMGGGG
jgi:hypothetical protein